jgi:hypothetical protein
MVLDISPPHSVLPPIFLADKTAKDIVEPALDWRAGDATGIYPPIEQRRSFGPELGAATGPVDTYVSFALYDETQDQRGKGQQFPGSAPTIATGPFLEDSQLADETQYQEDPMVSLRLASELGNEELFARAARSMNWARCSAADFVEAVRLALKVGAHLTALNLATRGVQHYPHNSSLQNMNRLLGPPRVLKTNLPPTPSLKANREWIRTHAVEYRGQWVALQEGRLIARASSVRELKAQAESLEGLLITRVV